MDLFNHDSTWLFIPFLKRYTHEIFAQILRTAIGSTLSDFHTNYILSPSFMWLKEELQKIQTDSLSIRQQLEIIQDNEFILCNLRHLSSIGILLRTSIKETRSSDVQSLTWLKESNLAWTNIFSFLENLFPFVWKAIGESNIFRKSFSDKIFPLNIENINLRIQSCKKVIEISRSLVYGGSLRYPFSQDIYAQVLHKILLQACQTSDIPGEKVTAGQNRILFLQNWLEKLIIASPLPTYLTTQTGSISPCHSFKIESAKVTDTKYSVSKFPLLQNKVELGRSIETLSNSSSSENTSFSAYLNKNKFKAPQFVGLKIKFDSDSSDSSISSEISRVSLRTPVFKKRKRSNLK